MPNATEMDEVWIAGQEVVVLVERQANDALVIAFGPSAFHGYPHVPLILITFTVSQDALQAVIRCSTCVIWEEIVGIHR